MSVCRVCKQQMIKAPDPLTWLELYEKFGFDVAMKWAETPYYVRPVYLRALLDAETAITSAPESHKRRQQ